MSVGRSKGTLEIRAASSQRAEPQFSVKLEALRGIAAMLVVGHHVFPTAFYPWMHILFNGQGAVSVFFVLSGYVLGLSLRRGTGSLLWQYWTFVVRRLLRIYPAFFFTMLVFLLYWKLYPFKQPLAALSHFQELRLSTSQVIRNFLFLDQSINCVAWSLKVEMAGSLVLPWLHFLSRNWRWEWKALLLLAMIGLSFVPASGSTRQCLYMFYLGYLLIDLQAGLAGRPFTLYPAVTIACLAAFAFARYCAHNELQLRMALLIEALSAAGVIVGLQVGGGSLGGLLSHPWTHYIGRVSYSLFLIHTLVEDWVVNLLFYTPLRGLTEHGYTFIFLLLGLAVSVPLALWISGLSYSWIESPFLKLGKRFGSAKIVKPASLHEHPAAGSTTAAPPP